MGSATKPLLVDYSVMLPDKLFISIGKTRYLLLPKMLNLDEIFCDKEAPHSLSFIKTDKGLHIKIEKMK